MIFLFPDCLSSHTLHPQSAPEEDPLFHRLAGPAAPHPLWFRHVTAALHEDDLPAHHDRDDTNQVQSSTAFFFFFLLSGMSFVSGLGLQHV